MELYSRINFINCHRVSHINNFCQISPLNLGSIQNPQFGVDWAAADRQIEVFRKRTCQLDVFKFSTKQFWNLNWADKLPCVHMPLFSRWRCTISDASRCVTIWEKEMKAKFSEMCRQQKLISKSGFWTKSNWKRWL